MTRENVTANIREELRRAQQSLGAASLLAAKGFLNEAVSRLYYFLLYHVRALLLTMGMETRSHEAALRLLGLHFVREGIFDRTVSHLFSTLMKYREEADYNPFYAFGMQDLQELREQAVNVADTMRRWIEREGYA